MKVRVATYNIAGAVDATHRFYNRFRRARSNQMFAQAASNIDRIGTRFAVENVGILALQEVDTCFAGSRKLMQSERLAARLSMSEQFLPSFDLNFLHTIRVRSGIATLSAYPTLYTRPVELPQRHVSPRNRLRGKLVGHKRVLHTALQVGEAQLHVLNAHLTHDSAAQREAELDHLLGYASQWEHTLILGDLNFTPQRQWHEDEKHPQPIDDRCLEILAQFRDRYPGAVHFDKRLGLLHPSGNQWEPLATCPARAPRYKFDYIFLLTRSDQISLEPEIVIDHFGSDHRPVVAELTFH